MTNITNESSSDLSALIGGENVSLVQFLLDLGISLSSESNPDRLLEKIVDESITLTNADGCTLYLSDDSGSLHFTISKNISMKICLGGVTGDPVSMPPVPRDPSFVSAYAAINKKIVNVPDVYKSTEFDFTGPKKYDEENCYCTKSMLVAPLTNYEGEVLGVMQLVNAKDPETNQVIAFDKKFDTLVHSLASFAAVAISNVRMIGEIRRRVAMLREANLDAIYSLAMAAEAKDDDTGDHVRRIQLYSIALAKKAGFTDEKADEIGYSSIMHDVGKISVPDMVLKKPGKLTDGEFDVMKAHTEAGSKILPATSFFVVARDIARHHHERWDGNGYPDGLKRGKIPIEARIVAITDVFDALTHKRAYKKAWTFEEAITEMKRCSGTHFDPRLMEIWEELYTSGELNRIFDSWHDS